MKLGKYRHRFLVAPIAGCLVAGMAVGVTTAATSASASSVINLTNWTDTVRAARVRGLLEVAPKCPVHL